VRRWLSWLRIERDFIETFDFRNVTKEVELREQVDKAREFLSGVKTDAIRNTATLRSKMRGGRNMH
jgi:hypothetical protein